MDIMGDASFQSSEELLAARAPIRRRSRRPSMERDETRRPSNESEETQHPPHDLGDDVQGMASPQRPAVRSMPPPSPRDARQQKRMKQKHTAAPSEEYTTLGSCDKATLKEYTQRNSNGLVSVTSYCYTDLELAEAFGGGHRKRSMLVPSANAQHTLFASGANVLQRLDTASRASDVSSSADEMATGVADADNGRHSRRSGLSSHSVAKLRRIRSSLSVDYLGGRSSGLGRAFSSTGSLLGLLRPSGAHSAGLTREMLETPPGATNAFESHKTLVHCPPPVRIQLHATRAERHHSFEFPAA